MIIFARTPLPRSSVGHLFSVASFRVPYSSVYVGIKGQNRHIIDRHRFNTFIHTSPCIACSPFNPLVTSSLFVGPRAIYIAIIAARFASRASRLAMATMTAENVLPPISSSMPGSRTGTPTLPDKRASTPQPAPPPASKPIPQDFRSSLEAWWNNSSYKEARIAEERLMRRMAMFEPTAPQQQAKGWFSWGSGHGGHHRHPDKEGANESPDGLESPSIRTQQHAEVDVNAETAAAQAIAVDGGLVAKLRDVFIPTPDPSLAPQHPIDPIEVSPPTSSASSMSGAHSNKCHHDLHMKHHRNKGKMVDYINTLEITSPENMGSKEAVVVLHGYAAALG